MANVIKLKRGSGSDPSASDLAIGELAIRTDTGKIFLKKDNGNVAEVSGGGGLSDGDKGDITVSNSGDTLTIDSGVIDNANINASAAIAGTKISPDFGSQNIATTGTLGSGDLTITGGQPALSFIDDGQNPDYKLYNNNGVLRLYDITNTTDRLVVNSDGHVDVTGNLDVGAGLDVTGNTTFANGNRTLNLVIADSPTTGNVGCQFRASANDFIGLAAGGGTGIGLVVDTSNKVGIGKTNPSQSLDVVGNITATQTVFAQNLTLTDPDPSIVFSDSNNDPDYRLALDSGVFQLKNHTSGADILYFSGGNATFTGYITTAGSAITSMPNGNAAPSGASYYNAGGDLFTGRVFIQGSGLSADSDFLTGFNNEGSDLVLYDYSNQDYLQKWKKTGSVELFHGGSGTTVRLKTESWGVSVAGNLEGMTSVSGQEYKIGTTTVLNSSRSLYNIGTFACSSTATIGGDATFAGNVTTGSQLTVSGAEPRLVFTDTDNNPDFTIWANAQAFKITDETNSTTRLTINSSGNATFSGSVTATGGFSGSGASLTSLPAGQLTGTIAAARLDTATTQSAGNNSTKIATTAYTDTAISNLVDSSPGTLNTLNELAAALGDDANFSTTVTNSIATKAVLSGSTNNTIATVTGANALQGEANLTFNGSGDLTVKGNDGISANLYLIADRGDDNGDGWRVGSNQDVNDLTFANNATGSYVDKVTLTGDKLMLSVDLKPDANNQRDFGTNSNRFKNAYFAGTVTAGTFSGSGASLTSLNASNISSGTIAAARVATLNQNTSGTAALATSVTVTANNGTNENVYLAFVDSSAGGTQGIETDAALSYNPSTNALTAGSFSGDLNATSLASGTVPTARLGSGTASSSTFLRGDGSWASAADSTKLPLAGGTLTGTLNGTSADFSGNILVGGNNSVFAENNLRFKSAGAAYIDHTTTSQSINFRVSNSSSLDVTALTLASSGNATFSGKIGIGVTPASFFHLRTSTNHNLEFEEASGNLRISALNDARSANEILEFAASSFSFLTGNATFAGSVTATGGFSGSGASLTNVNATTLDSIDSGSFLRSDASDSATQPLTFSGGGGAISIGGNSDIRLNNGSWAGNTTSPKIQAHDNCLYIAGGPNGIIFREDGTDRWHIDGSGHIRPHSDSTYNIGSSSHKVANGYFANINVSNDGAGSGLDADLFDGLDSTTFLRQQGDVNTQDWNTFIDGTEASWRTVLNHSGSNRPSSAYTYGTALSFAKSGQAKFQLYAPETGSSGNNLWYRTGWNTTYRAWVKILDSDDGVWTSGNDGSGSGLDADTLDGVQGANYLRSNAADSMSAKLTLNQDNDDEKLVLAGTSNPHIRWQEGTTNKAYIQWNASGYLEIRNQEDSSKILLRDDIVFSSDGSTLHKIWHAGNDGSGSGLDADTLDGFQTSQSGGASKVAVIASNGYLYVNNWISVANSTGLYAPGGSHFYNGGASTWQSWINQSTDSTSCGIGMSSAGTTRGWTYADSAHVGLLNAGGSWLFKCPIGNQNNPLTGNGYTLWHSNNDGAGSGLDADTLDGYNSDENATASTIVRRDGNGYIFAQHLWTTSGDRAGTKPTRFYASDDQYVRYYDGDYMRMWLGQSYKTANYGRKDSTTDSNYWVGAASWGNTSMNTLMGRGNVSWDTWSSPSGQPSGTSHWTGFNCLHYTNRGSDGSSNGGAYGWQMTMGAGTPALLYVRGEWTSSNLGTPTWYKVWNESNDGSGSGLDADTCDGQHLGTGSGPTFADVYVNSWLRNNDSTEGLYNSSTGQHWYSDNAAYFNLDGNGSVTGIRFRDSHNGTIRGYIYGNSSNEIGFLNSSGGWAFQCNSSSSNMSYNHLLPSANNSKNLGSSSYRWANLYVNDLQLSNESQKEEGGNSVDGTWGDWTLQEGEDNIFMINNRSGKKFKMLLQEV